MDNGDNVWGWTSMCSEKAIVVEKDWEKAWDKHVGSNNSYWQQQQKRQQQEQSHRKRPNNNKEK